MIVQTLARIIEPLDVVLQTPDKPFGNIKQAVIRIRGRCIQGVDHAIVFWDAPLGYSEGDLDQSFLFLIYFLVNGHLQFMAVGLFTVD